MKFIKTRFRGCLLAFGLLYCIGARTETIQDCSDLLNSDAPNQDLVQLACQTRWINQGCDELERELQKTDPNSISKLERCDKGHFSRADAQTWEQEELGKTSCLAGGRSAIQNAYHSFKNLMSEGFNSYLQDVTNCTTDRKKQIYSEYNQAVTLEDFLQVPDEVSLSKLSCEGIRGQINRDKFFKGIQGLVNFSPSQSYAQITAFLKSLGLRYECYKPEIKVQMICSAATSLGLSAIASAGAKRIVALSSLAELSGSTRVLEAVKALDQDGTPAIIAAYRSTGRVPLGLASQLNERGRWVSAEGILGRTLKSTEKDALLKAHQVGLEESGYHTFSPQELRQKVRTLIDGGFSREEADFLMRNGIAGSFNPNSAVDQLQKLVQNNKDLIATKYQDPRQSKVRQLEQLKQQLNSTSTVGRVTANRLLAENARLLGNPAISQSFYENLYNEVSDVLKKTPNLLNQSASIAHDYAQASATIGDLDMTRKAMKAVVEQGYRGQGFSRAEDYAQELATRWLGTSSNHPLDRLRSLRLRKAVIEVFYGNERDQWRVSNTGWYQMLTVIERDLAATTREVENLR